MECTHCEMILPEGCHHFAEDHTECPLGNRTDLPWIVGKEVWKDLMDRRGIKSELEACDPPIQVEIVESIGRLAIEAYQRAEGSGGK